MSEAQIELSWKGDAATIALNDQAAMNAVSSSMLTQLLAALDQVEARARALVLTGRGRAFCAGANLARLQNSIGTSPETYDPGTLLETAINPILKRLRNLPIPWIAAVNGPAVGVGAGFALGADLILAGTSAFFQFAFGRVGLAPDGGSSFLLSRAVGRVRASELLLLGERLSAEQALEWGLVNRVVADERLLDEAGRLAARLAEGPTRSFALARQAVWAGLEGCYEDALDRERRDQRVAGATVDHREGIAAFRAKRPPNYIGR